MLENITYQELIKRYGQVGAYSMLLLIEQSVPERAKIIHFDEETRLQKALQALDHPAPLPVGHDIAERVRAARG